MWAGRPPRPEQRRQATPVSVGQLRGPFLVGEDVLDHEGVDVHQGGLQYAQAQHGQFLLVSAVGGDVAALAEKFTLFARFKDSTTFRPSLMAQMAEVVLNPGLRPSDRLASRQSMRGGGARR
ncbi:hypothetical protein KRMM14A1004_49080 [Krasilnikovia sp. MM14-A1004]